MNLLRLRKKSRKHAGNISTTDYANTDLDADINEGIEFLAQEIADVNQDFFEEQKSKFDLKALSSLYSLPTDFLKLKQLRLAYEIPSTEDDYVVADNNDVSDIDNPAIQEGKATTTNPIVDITNNYFRISPMPTVDSTAGGSIYYIARPSGVVNTADIPVIPKEFHFLIPIYAGKEIAFEKKNWKTVDRLEVLLDKGIGKMKNALASRELDRDKKFTSTIFGSRRKKVREL